MLSVFLRNLLFTILLPGIVAGYVPILILGNNAIKTLEGPMPVTRYTGAMIFLAGLTILLNCIYRFAVEGRGTLAPIDKTKNLVTSGLYRYSRNPMYLGVLLILIGEAVFFRSSGLWIYLSCVFIAFNIFIIVIEEPRLKDDFGNQYAAYRNKVRRWL